MKPLLILRARHVLPISTPALIDGAIAIQGNRIVGIGPDHKICKQFPRVPVLDLGNSVLMPGLINAHAHLEIPGPVPQIGLHPRFDQWVLALLKRFSEQRIHAEDSSSQLAQTLLSGVEQSLRGGVTTIADITRQPALTRPILAASPLRVISFGEIRAMGQRRILLEGQLADAVGNARGTSAQFTTQQADGPQDISTGQSSTALMTHGLSPHAPYSVEPAGYARCVEECRRRNLPLMTHLAETLAETEFLNHHTGDLKNIWDFLGGWDENIPTFTGSAIAFSESFGLLSIPSLLAHVNYCDDEQLQRLSRGKASVVYCPRTHEYFGHPPHRWRDMLEAGINLCLGTDSRASSPDLNLLDDLRLLQKLAPEMPAQELLKLVTLNAAYALSRPDLGQLAPGCLADIACYPAPEDADTAGAILRDPSLTATALWIDGQHVPLF